MQLLKRLGKAIEKSIRLLKINILLRRRYGTRWPERVRYPDADYQLAINPRDYRAIKKVALDFARGRIDRNIHYWRDFVAHNNPTLCIDIGANYGECLFSTEYGEHTHVLAVEANTRLIPYLEKSRELHPSRERIEIQNVAAGDEEKDAIPLYVDTNWSGGTTAVDKAGPAGGTETIHVPQKTVDSLLSAEQVSAGPVVFKLDVEGFEPFVLRGMQQTIAQAPLIVGYIEIDLNFIAATGVTLADLDGLLAPFQLYWPTDKRNKRLRPIASLAALKELLGEGFHTDVIAVKAQDKDKGNGWLPASWRIEQD